MRTTFSEWFDDLRVRKSERVFEINVIEAMLEELFLIVTNIDELEWDWETPQFIPENELEPDLDESHTQGEFEMMIHPKGRTDVFVNVQWTTTASQHREDGSWFYENITHDVHQITFGMGRNIREDVTNKDYAKKFLNEYL